MPHRQQSLSLHGMAQPPSAPGAGSSVPTSAQHTTSVPSTAGEHLAHAWAAFKLAGKTASADTLERIGRGEFGDAEFERAMQIVEVFARSAAAEEESRMSEG
ncbi:hypothetical protein LTR36_001060 [Oleoguttula mirabilis]|uniref:Uncharacterized protein n=1 Tax=Oleoguttula mirabilis TaxID=1507867 RepID=A0AAV9JPS5_9PEZI|nr:hypothetical protein LTR36_001060 [Oleoguttula mirabilis]